MRRGENDIAYIQNRRTGAVVKAAARPNASGFVLKELSPGDTPGEYVAKVERQGELLTLTYDRGVAKAAAPSKPRGKGPSSPAGQSSSKPKPDFNPAQLALEKAREQAAKARDAKSQSKGETSKGKAANNRKRTIFVP